MLDYIKGKIIAQKIDTVQESVTDDVPDEVITEYAHIFQELDDLSVEGTDADRDRKLAIDIPLENDAEVENVEFNINDGRVTDVPGDATVVEQYQGMKTYDDFVNEIVKDIPKFQRESDSAYKQRIKSQVDELYAEYCSNVAECGLYGFDKINIGDESVPSKINVDFGTYKNDDSKSFFAKVKTIFATDEDHNIRRRQLDAIKLVQEGAFHNIGPALMGHLADINDIPEGMDVWDIVTPKSLIVPEGDEKSFCVVLEYVNELNGGTEYFGWTRKIKPDNDGIIQESSIDDCVELNMKSFASGSYEDRLSYIQNSKERMKKLMNRPTRGMYMESIDFGGADNNDGGSDLPPVSQDDNTDSGNDNSGGDDGNIDTGNVSDAPESNDDSGDKESATVNNVSEQIAEKVSQQTEDNNNTTDDVGGDIDDSDIPTFDDDMNGDSSSNDSTDDIGGDDEAGASIDDQIDDLDNGDESAPVDGDEEGGDIDIDNMTIDELIETGSDKLKGMTLNQIKDFITNSDPSTVQEAFIITSKNVNKEIDVNIRKCLGILNDSEMNVDKIISKFKIAGHRLNRVLSKASKMKNDYSSDELENISKLNKSLTELMTSLKKSNKSSHLGTVKRAISEFTENCNNVATFVEEKLTGENKIQQEGFVQEGLFLSSKNVRRRLCNKIEPVYEDLNEIVKLYDQGKLTRGKINRMYKPTITTRTNQVSTNYTDSLNASTSQSRDISTSTIAMDNLESLSRIISKIRRKPKIASGFNEDELHTIDDLNEQLLDFIDYIESVVEDNSDNKSILNQIGKDTKRLLELMKSFINNTDTGFTGHFDSNTTTDGPAPEASMETEPVFDEDDDDFSVEDNNDIENGSDGDDDSSNDSSSEDNNDDDDKEPDKSEEDDSDDNDDEDNKDGE